MSKNQLAIMKRDIVDAVEEKVEKLTQKGELHLPEKYSAPNALKAAWLVLQDTKDKSKQPVLSACSKNSIANSLFYMVMMGLNPQKKQCDFIAYGKKLTCQPEYTGNISLAKRKANAKEVYPHAIYKGDEFEYEVVNGRTKITKPHKTSLENKLKGEYLGGYCVIEWNDDRPDHVEVMTIDEIEAAWKQGPNYSGGYEKGNGTHGKFTEEMIKKTVVNRATKRFIRSSDDSDLFIKAYNQSDTVQAEQEVKEEIEENANSQVLDIDYEETEEGPAPQPEPEENEVEQEEPEEDPAAKTEKERPGQTEKPEFV